MVGLTSKEALNFDEAVAYSKLSPSFLYKLTSQQKISHYKPGGKLIYFNRLELEAWLFQNKVSTSDEITGEALSYCMTKKGGTK